MFNKRGMLKRKVSVVVLGLILIFAVGLVDAAETPIRLKFSAFFPETNPEGARVKELCGRLENASGGRVKIDIYWAGALGVAPRQVDVVRDGLADLSLAYPVYNPARFPLSLFPELPLSASSSRSATAVVVELVKRKLITDEFKKADLKLISACAYPPNQIYSNKKIMKVDDFKGVRMWSSGPVMEKTLSLLGASGIMLPWHDIYMGLERGTLDAMQIPWLSSIAMKMYQVTKYPIEIGLMGGYFATMIMNRASWNKLPPNVQAEWQKVGAEFSPWWAGEFDAEERKFKQMWVDKDIAIMEFPSSEKKKLAQKLIPVWQAWIDRNEAKGKGKSAKEIYKIYVEVMKKLDEPVLIRIPDLYE